MKILFFLFILAHSALADTYEEIEFEVGAPRDCVTLGTSSDQVDASNDHDLQKKVMDCLSPQEEEAPVEIKKQIEIVNQ